MKLRTGLPRSLQYRLAFSLAVLLAMLWAAAAWVTAQEARKAMEAVFDSALQETAQRILPLAVSDILGRDEPGVTQRLAQIREHDELLTYLVRDDQGRVLLRSHDADPAIFPAWTGPGFSQSDSHRFYSEASLQGSVRLTLAEPLAQRRIVARRIQMGLGMPLLIFLPVVLLAVFFIVQITLRPIHRFRERLATRGARDLSSIQDGDLPAELVPVAATVNDLLGRLNAAFEAERSFAANAAHELRTPLAGAIAQAQRLKAETLDPSAQGRAADIEATLKRLTRLAERLMQLARAEGGRLRVDQPSDLRRVAQMLVDDLNRGIGDGRIELHPTPEPVLSDLDPDIFAILLRNLVDNALRHGALGTPVEVSLDASGELTVANDGPVVPEAVRLMLAERFERAGARMDGSGLGLSIVHAIAQRIGGALVMRSPRTGQSSGFEVSVRVPVSSSPGTS